jgi:cobyrinic acid a,c-diamide synthase
MAITDLPTRPNNLETLSIECPHLPQNLGQVVSSCCPKLTSLSFIGGVANDMKFHLSHNHLELLNNTSYHNQDEKMHSFLLKYANVSHPLCFVERLNNPNSLNSLIELGKVKESEGRVVIEVECAYANDIAFKAFAKRHIPFF